MTIEQIYEGALALSLSKISENLDTKDFVLPIFNILMGECAACNNAIRKSKGLEKQKLTEVKAFSEENPMEAELDTALKYGLAAKILIADYDFELGNVYYQRYIDEVSAAAPWEEMEV